MKWLSRLDSAAGAANRCLLIVAIALGLIDLTIYMTQAVADPGWHSLL